MTRINVLSLFGGIECGRVAMDRLGWEVGNYYSSEIDEYAKKITSARWPDIIHVWSVTDVSYIDTPQGGVLQTGNFSSYETTIDILIGGSPCQDLSIAKAWGKGLEGEKSGLFYEYVRILQETKPAYFLLENVASMKKADKDKITEIIGVDPIMINSNLLSAQNRKRLYWIGRKIQGGGYETVQLQQPEDRGILLADILEDIPLEDERWKPLDPKYFEKLEKYDWGYSEHNSIGKIRQGYEYFTPESKVWSLTVAHSNNRRVLVWQYRRTDLRIHAEQDKVCTLTSNMGTGGNNVPTDSEVLLVSKKAYPVTATYAGACPRDYLEKHQRELVIRPWEKETQFYWRKLTVKECERLQTLTEIKKRIECRLWKDILKSFVSAEQKNHKLQNVAGNVEKNKLQEIVKSAEKNIDLSYQKNNVPVLLSVLIDLEEKKLQLQIQNDVVSSVQYAEKQNEFPRQNQIENIVPLSVELFENLEKIISNGNEELQKHTNLSIAQENGNYVVEIYGQNINESAKDAYVNQNEAKKQTTKYTMSKATENINPIDSIEKTLHFFVRIAINSCIQNSISIENLSQINFEFVHGYTFGVSNSRRYKAIGNGWTCDVIAHILKYCNF